jgi:hypothetical protein
MLKSIIIAILGLFAIIGVLLNSDGMHWPLLVLMLVAFGVGFTNPDKGWTIAICLVFSLLAYGLYFEKLDLEPENPKMIHFFCNISVLPVLFGGFMGRYFKRISTM